jgi:hypothetical protein
MNPKSGRAFLLLLAIVAFALRAYPAFQRGRSAYAEREARQ